MGDQEQVPQAPANPVADVIISASAPPADNAPANAENLEEIFKLSFSPRLRTTLGVPPCLRLLA